MTDCVEPTNTTKLLYVPSSKDRHARASASHALCLLFNMEETNLQSFSLALTGLHSPSQVYAVPVKPKSLFGLERLGSYVRCIWGNSSLG